MMKRRIILLTARLLASMLLASMLLTTEYRTRDGSAGHLPVDAAVIPPRCAKGPIGLWSNRLPDTRFLRIPLA